MKRIIISALVVLAFCSCQKEEKPVARTNNQDFIISATINQTGDTKVTYEENSSNALKQMWEETDEVFGFDEDNNLITLQVATRSEGNTKATFSIKSGTLTNGKKVHMIYYPGKTTADIKTGKLAVDISRQAAGIVPAIMIATGTVSSNTLELSFSNVTAVFGVKTPTLTGVSSKQVDTLILSSHNIVCEGEISVNEGVITMTPGAPSKFIHKGLLEQTTDGSGKLAGTYYIAILPCSTVEEYPLVLTARTNEGNIYSKSYGAKTIAAANYYYSKPTMTQVTLPTVAWTSSSSVKWADRNLGADTAFDWGDYYNFATGRKAYSSYSYDNTKKQWIVNGLIDSKFFKISRAPYNTGADNSYSKYNSVDKKTKLDPIDDIVQLTYPGSGWRIPYKSEAEELITYFGSSQEIQTYSKDHYYIELKKDSESIIMPLTGNTLFIEENPEKGTSDITYICYFNYTFNYLLGETKKGWLLGYESLAFSTNTLTIGGPYRGTGNTIRPVYK